MNPKRIAGFVLLAVSLALLVYVVPEVRNHFAFTGLRIVSYSQPYPGHAAGLLLAIAGIVVSFLAGLLLIGLSRRNR